MIDIEKSITLLNSEADRIASENLKRFQDGKDETLKFGTKYCARFVKNALIYGGASRNNSTIGSAKDYGPWLLENGFFT